MLEEANIIIDIKRYIGSLRIGKDEARWYECLYVGGELEAGDDLEDVKWVDKKDVPKFCSGVAISHWPEEVRNYLGYHPNL